MVDERLVGKWRYAQNEKFRKHVKEIAALKLALKLDENAEEQLEVICGCKLKVDCPFVHKGKHADYCLAPRYGKEWYEAIGGRFQIHWTYRQRNQVMGCYIHPFCVKGLEVYERWVREGKLPV
jgi:hypothetical protein